jgi:hypothetical protein
MLTQAGSFAKNVRTVALSSRKAVKDSAGTISNSDAQRLAGYIQDL